MSSSLISALSRSCRPPPLKRPRTTTRTQKRSITTEQVFHTRFGKIKLDLKDKRTVGVAQSRGERPYQEDAYSISSLLVPNKALKSNVLETKGAEGWNPDMVELEGYEGEGKKDDVSGERKKQVAFFGVFDGHGGSAVSKYLQSNLATLLESSTSSEISEVVDQYRSIGGYLKRYRGGPLSRFRDKEESKNRALGLDEMAVLAFLKADNAVLSDESTGKAGSVATVALLHSLDVPHSHPFYGSSLISLTLAHLGDTRAILASQSSGRARIMTENHHPDSRIESERLRQSGTGIVTDSFGESRWGGTLANTRGIGDREFKGMGVIGEPVVSTTVLKGNEWAFMVLLSDGITDAMSDQEVVDLCRNAGTPARAAAAIVSFAEDVGGEDNMTAIVVPLPGWGKMGGTDSSSSRREYRLRQNTGQSSRQKRM